MFSPPPIPFRYSSQHSYLSNFIIFFHSLPRKEERREGGREWGGEREKEKEMYQKITKMKVKTIKYSKRKLNKKCIKYHCVCFVLHNDSWAWVLPWIASDIPSKMSLNKANFPFASGYQLQIAYCLMMGLHVYLHVILIYNRRP